MATRTPADAGAPPARRAATSAPTPLAGVGVLGAHATGRCRRRCEGSTAGGVAVAVLALLGVLLSCPPPALAKNHVFEKPAKILDNPKFHAAIVNETAPLGREAILTCLVDDLGNYKVAWLRVDTQTILTIANHVITKNHRIGVSQADQRTWKVHIKDVRESDRGWYMCQINTDPMKSQQGFLDIVVPPDILDYPTSTDMVVRELSNATLRCAATGSPPPNITWRREDGRLLQQPSGREAPTAEGPTYSISRVTREHMGAYLCIASNGVPPSVSKRIWLTVEFPPVIEIPNQLVGARLGRPLELECSSQASPKSVNYWVKGDNSLVQGAGYETELIETTYSIQMTLTIRSMTPSDFGEYKCVSKNYLGETEQSIKVDHLKTPESNWGPVATKLPKHAKGKYHNRPVSENSVEVPDAEESTASSSGTHQPPYVFLVPVVSALVIIQMELPVKHNSWARVLISKMSLRL